MLYPDLPEVYYCELCTSSHQQADEEYSKHAAFARGSNKEKLIQVLGELPAEGPDPAPVNMINLDSQEGRTLEIVAACFNKMVEGDEVSVVVGWKGKLFTLQRENDDYYTITVSDPRPAQLVYGRNE